MTQGGYIYAIGTDGSPFIKIGMTSMTIASRMAALQSGHPSQLKLIAAVQVSQGLAHIEKYIHNLLASVRHHGEWFDVDMDAEKLRAFVAEATATYAEPPQGVPFPVFHKEARLGIRIRALRERKGLNQSELARQCGIAPATISRLESGDLKDVQTAIAKRIAEALEVSIDYLVGRYEHEPALAS